MTKKWEWKPIPDESIVDTLVNDLGIARILCELLVQRGITNYEEAKSYFRPHWDMLHDPFDMKDMDFAVELLTDAIFNEQKILIYGDYDVDGTTSVALLYNFLKNFSPNVFTYIPDRYTEGYGVSKKGIQWAIDHQVDLMICLDCGIRAVDTLSTASENGLDVIICDHHLPGDTLPPAKAILDPKQEDCAYPYEDLSGCGIGFKLLQAFCQQNGIEEERVLKYLDLVAVSIASDIVPITGENRTLAYFGLKKLNAEPVAGLAALIEKAGLRIPMNISDVVFGIGPRINAAGRINHAKTALDLLTQENKNEAFVFAEKLNLENTERKNFDERITEQALAQIEAEQPENHSSVLFNPEWHKGVIGIVASRCIEKYYRPTIVMTESNGKIAGSARSVNGYDIHKAIGECAEHLDQFGGHQHAAGLTLQKENLEAFKAAFEKTVAGSIQASNKEAKVEIDLDIELNQIDFNLVNILKQMGPYGPQNMQPVFCARKVKLKNEPRLLKDKHLKLFVHQEENGPAFDAIGFGLGYKYDQLGEEFDIAFTIEENHFRGETSLQLNLKDIKA